jgi:hypothetical protein
MIASLSKKKHDYMNGRGRGKYGYRWLIAVSSLCNSGSWKLTSLPTHATDHYRRKIK